MKRRISTGEALLAAVVLLHLGVCVLHGLAHARAHVTLSPASMRFVIGVILIGPVVGLIAERTAFPRGGAWVIAATLGSALVFGLLNHFLIPGADHVSHVAGPWSGRFGTTAASLGLTEALGTVLAVRCAARARRSS